MLFIVATPIGNLKDITLRAQEILKAVDLILAEDTRVTKNLLMHIESSVQVQSYHQHSSFEKKLEILSMLNDGKDIALVTDAGTPGVSDPGNELVEFLLSKNPAIEVSPIPGPSSVTAAMSVSGFDVSTCTIIGFLPKKKRLKLFKELSEKEEAIVCFESPYRIQKTMEEMESFMPERQVCVCLELTKLHERMFRGNASEILKRLEEDEKKLGRIKGEIVVVIDKKH
jgi:16S rRNA (cytidine1402-2'-O)-methyltransferase